MKFLPVLSVGFLLFTAAYFGVESGQAPNLVKDIAPNLSKATFLSLEVMEWNPGATWLNPK